MPLLNAAPSPPRHEEIIPAENVRGEGEFSTKLAVVSGLIRDNETQRMLRLLYRVSRGKVAAFFKTVGPNESDFELLGESVPLSCVFNLVFEDNKSLEIKVLKICQSFTQHTYAMPRGFTREMRHQKIIDLQREIKSSISLL